MSTLVIRELSGEESFGHLDLARHRGFNLKITFPDGSILDFDYAVPKKYNKDSALFPNERLFTTSYSEFLSAHQKGTEATFGRIWHDYCADPPIRTKDGKIGLYLTDFAKRPTLELNPSLAQQLLSELRRFS